jgi:hypothetical protein
VVSIGNAGLSKAVLREIELSLEHHELMKIKVGGAERDKRKQFIDRRTGTGHRAYCAHLPQASGLVIAITSHGYQYQSKYTGQQKQHTRHTM